MRLMLMAGAGRRRKVEGYLSLEAVVTATTPGVISENVSTICPPCFLTTGDGTLLMATGYGPMLRMRQNEKRLTLAGVPSPKLQPIILNEEQFVTQPQQTTFSKRFIYSNWGQLKAVRGVDTAQGALSMQARQSDYIKYGKLAAPLPNEDSLALTQRVYNMFFGTSKSYQGGGPENSKDSWLYLGFDLLIYNQSAPNSPTSTAYSGRYQAFMRYVDKDENFSNPSPISADTLVTDASYIQYSNLETPSDPRVVRRQIFRNVNGESDYFCLDIDTDDLTSTELYSRNTDAQLKLAFQQPVFDDNNNNLFFLYSEPPSDKPYIAEFNARIFAAGFRIYFEGNAIVENGSATVTGVGTNWQQSFQGRRFVAGGNTYTIINCDPETQIITLDRAYETASSPYLTYVIQLYYANSNLLQWSQAGLPEAWGSSDALQLPDDDDIVTGLIVFANNLWILKRNKIYQFNFTIDPAQDGDYKLAAHRGCINQRCAVEVQNVCLMLDRTGIHLFRGNLNRLEYQIGTTPDHLNKPIGDMFRFEGSGLRINWNADTCFWHAAHNKEMQTVRFYVTLQGYKLPHHAICYDYLMDRWWVEAYPVPVSSSHQSSNHGNALLGGFGGKVYRPDIGTLDLIEPSQTRQTVVACYGTTLVVEGPLPDCVGIPISVVAGRGRGQDRMVFDQDDDELYLDIPFEVEPDETSIVQIGAIPYELITPEYRYVKYDNNQTMNVTIAFHGSKYDLEGYLSFIEDGERRRSTVAVSTWGCINAGPDDPEVWQMNLKDKSGRAMVNMDATRERDLPIRYTIQAIMTGHSGLDKPYISEIIMMGASEKNDYSV